MNLIALVDKKWGIANKGRELVDIPEDKKLFREETYGKVVIMGRKTLEALPNQSALVGRKNIVLTRNKDYEAKDVCLCHSVEDVLEKVKMCIVRMYMSSVVDRYTKNSFHIVIQHILQRLITLTKQILI